MLKIASQTCATVMLALVLSVPTLSSPASAAAAGSPEAYRMASSYNQSILYWTNVARRNYGRTPLRPMGCLDRFATNWTVRMASRDFMGHQSMTTMLRTCQRSSVGENVAYATGSPSARRLVSMWMHSRGHRANILNRGFRYIGIGAYRSADTGRVYATQDFGR